MSSLTAIMALKALDALTMRAEVTSQNIANADSPGYRPLRVTFEDALADASTRGPDAVEALEPTIERDPSAAESSGVRLDLQMATASMTTTRYAALVEILALQLRQTRAVLGN